MDTPAGDHDHRSPPTIVTPEAVALDLPLASVGSRGIAFLIDATAIGISLLLLVLGGTAIATTSGRMPGWVGATAVVLLVLAVQFGYPIAFETLWRGRTPGKAALGLRVVTVEGGPVRFRHAATRAILGIVDFHLTFGAAALVSAFVSARAQRVGDLVAGTLVVRERSGAGRAEAATFAVPSGLDAVARTLDVAAVTAADYAAVRAFLQRSPTLAAGTRASLARDLLARIEPRVRPRLDTELPPLIALQVVAAAVQGRGTRPSVGSARPPDPYHVDVWAAPSSRPDAAAHRPAHDHPPPSATGGFTAPS